jgi:predicted acyltransferase
MTAIHQSAKNRIVSLDQFRGYTVVGMLLVNYLGGFREVGAIWKHHNTYCSYADTIMPQFFFAVGFAMRLTFLRRLKSAGAYSAVCAAVKRNLGLILLGFVIYHLDKEAKTWDQLRDLGLRGFLSQAFQREVFQTLVHIALASLWVMPVIAAGTAERVGFLIATSVLHLGLSHWFYFRHAWDLPVIDGGPLGFLTWSIPVLIGSLAYDAVAGKHESASLAGKLLAWSMVLMGLGFGLSCLAGTVPTPPFVEPTKGTPVTLWTMSQRTGSVSYQVFGAGISLAVYALFVVICDPAGVRLGMFQTFGQNPLAAYIVHPMVAGAVKPYVPDDAPLWFVFIGFLLYFGVCYLLIHYLEKNDLYLRL